MGLFSFGSREKEEERLKKSPLVQGKPEPITGEALMRTFAIDDLDYLLKAYAPETWDDISGILQGVAFCTKKLNYIDDKFDAKLDAITSRLDDISRRLDALEQRTQDLPQRER